MVMPAPDFAMLVLAALASVAAGFAYSMLLRANPRFRAAKVLSWVSALGFWSVGVIWGATASVYPLGWRMAAAGAAGAVVSAALVWVIADINSQSKPPPTVANNRIQIILGPYDTVEPAGINRSRTVRIRIENNTDNEISDGQLDILNLDPPASGHERLLLKGEIRLAPRKHTFAPVASYNEGTSQAKPGTWIRLAIPIAPVYGGGPGNLPVQPHTFHLKFSSPEFGVFDEVACRLFVDSGHVLHLEGWTN
jgi:hypothetical protein